MEKIEKFLKKKTKNILGLQEVISLITLFALLFSNVLVFTPEASARPEPNGFSSCDPRINLISNGSFEEPVLIHSSGWDIFPSVAGNWTVEWRSDIPTDWNGHIRPEPANLELHKGVNSWIPYKGDQYAELDSDWNGHNPGPNGEPASIKIYQDLVTNPGQKYLVKFAFSPRPGTAANQNTLEVKWDTVVYTVPPTPGGSNTIWTVHEVEFTASNSLTRIEFTDLGTPNSEGTFLDDVQVYCQPITIIAHKIVCENEMYLPKWGGSPGLPEGDRIDENTAQDWLNFIESEYDEGLCRFESGWNFQWADGTSDTPGNPGDNLGPAGGLWNDFGPTNSEGQAVVTTGNITGDRIWVREVMKEGYLPFSGVEGTPPSAEFYCHEDVYKYDNYDYILNPVEGNTYYCVGFNVPIEEPETGSITIYKYYDDNGDGEFNEGDYVLPGWEVSIWADHIQLQGAPFFTNEEGKYVFSNLPLGTYDVCEFIPEGWENTQPGYDPFDWSNIGEGPWAVCYEEVVLSEESIDENNNLNVYFGNRQVGEITVYKEFVLPEQIGQDLSQFCFMVNEDGPYCFDQGSSWRTVPVPYGPYEITEVDPGEDWEVSYEGDCEGTIDNGEEIPNGNGHENGNGNGPVCTITNTYVGEEDPEDDSYSLNASVTGFGWVTSDPAGINCGYEASDCSKEYLEDTVVTLTATPGGGQKFDGWGGDCSGTSTTCELTMDGAKNVSAAFSLIPGVIIYQFQPQPEPEPEEESEGEVLGEETVAECGIYLFEYIKYGASNNPTEVIKLQKFLNDYMGSSLPLSGIYDWATMQVLNQFQVQCKEEVLKPWVDAGVYCDANQPTGYVYKTTQRWINLIMCPPLNLPMPDLSGYEKANCLGYFETGDILGEEIELLDSEGSEEMIEDPEVFFEDEEILEEEIIEDEVEPRNTLFLFIVLLVIGILVYYFFFKKRT